jgi:hypothetical protein
MNTPMYGLMAEFKTPEMLLSAVKAARAANYKMLDAYSPFPIDGLAESINKTSTRIEWIAFCGGTIGILSGIALQYYSAAIGYPMNIGGRPLISWPAYVPICFELMVLFSVLFMVFAMFYLNKLPRPYHPVFNVPDFSLVSKDRFFIVIENNDPLFDLQKTRLFFETLKAEKIFEVNQ